MRSSVAFLLTSACTHLNAVGGGVTDDDFYLITNKQFLIFTSPAVVLHCTRAPSAPVACERVLTTDQAAAYSRNVHDDAYLACAYAGEIDATYLEAPELEEAVADYADATELERRACRHGYATSWNRAVRLWNADHPDEPHDVVPLPFEPASAPVPPSTPTPSE